jgi:hypothetical protein
MKTHWLHGSGPNKEVKFNVEIDKEDKCSTCTHNIVCGKNMERRCQNYQFGCSGENGCHGCLHRYTRWDGKDSLPCFKCNEYSEDKELVQLYFDLSTDLADLQLQEDDIILYANIASHKYYEYKLGDDWHKKGSKELPKVPYDFIVDHTRKEVKELRDKRKKVI